MFKILDIGHVLRHRTYIVTTDQHFKADNIGHQSSLGEPPDTPNLAAPCPNSSYRLWSINAYNSLWGTCSDLAAQLVQYSLVDHADLTSVLEPPVILLSHLLGTVFVVSSVSAIS